MKIGEPTAGEWHYMGTDADGDGITEYGVFASPPDGGEPEVICDGLRKADAMVMAASKELLVELKKLVERIERANGWDQRGDGLGSAREAIHKATAW